MARVYVPAVRCPFCQHPNDFNFRYCQMCAYRRKVVNPLPSNPPQVDIKQIDARLDFLTCASLSTPYEKQKQSLKQELQSFLSALPGKKTIFSASPRDVCRFLVWKDKAGKTQVHCNGCSYLGKHGVHLCGCPVRLSYTTVDSYIGKLRAIFHSVGRQGEWESSLQLGNPASALEVKSYFKTFTSEQLQARITVRQAVPLFLPKLHTLARLLNRKMSTPGISAQNLYIIARDQAFLKTLFFGGDRGSDLGNVKTPEILRFPSDDGFLFNHIWGKTLRDGSSNLFGIRRHPNPAICPVAGIETYVAICSELAIDLSKGYLFRPTSPQGDVLDKPFSSSTAQQRLKLYLKEAKIDEGETLHSLRSGCAITLALSGAPLADVMSHVGWKDGQTALYYMKLAEVLRQGASSRLLSSENVEPSSSCTQYTSLDSLKSFVCAFPSTPSGVKRSCSTHSRV